MDLVDSEAIITTNMTPPSMPKRMGSGYAVVSHPHQTIVNRRGIKAKKKAVSEPAFVTLLSLAKLLGPICSTTTPIRKDSPASRTMAERWATGPATV